ncbi:tetratricopeptide repeat protein [Streptomyces sp. CAU 1734]|uniref:tetratricopeptide repeat protein n=1 Tax=Streptomyces sp. CAU 1734 TaxID=3140360 RepID=UPI003261AB6C
MNASDQPCRDRELAEAVRLRELGTPESRAEARRLLLDLARRLPADAGVAYQTAWIHDVLGLEAEAVPHYERALAVPGGLGPADRAEALLGLGSTYRILGRQAEAESLLRSAVAEFPGHGGLRVFWAMALFGSGRHEHAVQLLLRLLAATSGDPSVRDFRRAIETYADELTPAVRQEPRPPL